MSYLGGIWDAVLGRTTIPLTAQSAAWGQNTRIPSDPAIRFFELNGSIQWENLQGSERLKRIYEICSPLSSIINHKAKCYASGNLEVLNANTDNYVRGKYKEWEQLLNNPNPLQSKRQFFRQLYTYTVLNGFCLVYKVYASGFKDRPYKLWVLPYWCIEVMDKYKPLQELTKDEFLDNIYFTYGGVRTKLDPDNLILFTDETGDLNERTWMPISRVAQCQYPITEVLSAVEANVTLIQKKGAIGILSNQSQDAAGHISLTADQQEQIQRDFQKYGLTREQWQVIITSANLQWQPMAFPVRDLMLHESYLKSVKDICFAFDFPLPLVPHSDQSTYNNIRQASINLYQNAIIPEADALDEQLMIGLNAADNNIRIRHDYSHIAVLQESQEELGKGRKMLNEAFKIEWDNGLITKNEWLKGLGEDEKPEEIFKKYKFQLTPEELGVIDFNRKPNNNAPEDKGTKA